LKKTLEGNSPRAPLKLKCPFTSYTFIDTLLISKIAYILCLEYLTVAKPTKKCYLNPFKSYENNEYKFPNIKVLACPLYIISYSNRNSLFHT